MWNRKGGCQVSSWTGASRNAGVKNFDKFHNAGYKGLYSGENANDIAKKKDCDIEKIFWIIWELMN